MDTITRITKGPNGYVSREVFLRSTYDSPNPSATVDADRAFAARLLTELGEDPAVARDIVDEVSQAFTPEQIRAGAVRSAAVNMLTHFGMDHSRAEEYVAKLANSRS